MSHPDTTSKDAVFQWRGIPQPGQLLPLGLQHVVAAVVGVITPAILVADTCGLSSADKTLMIQVSLILTALATLLQLFPIFHRIGSGLPVIMGISFAYIPTLQAIGGEFGLPTILGAEIVGGIVAIVFGVLVKWIRPLFPPLVTGTVIFTIGLSLYPTAVKYMAGGAGSEWFGSAKSWAVALITLAVVVFLNHFTKGITKLASTSLPRPQWPAASCGDPHWHTGRLCHCLFPGHRGSVRGGQRGLGRPAQAHAL